MYSYDDLTKDLSLLRLNGYKIEYIGVTVYGKRIPALLRGEKPHTLIVGGTHARENITSLLVTRLAKSYTGKDICFIPMLNPDGVEIVEKGLNAVPHRYQSLIESISLKTDLRLWKANGRGVDINVNYDADWAKGKSNIFYPWSENFVGKRAGSEPETVASVNFIKKYNFDTLISYHSKGEVIYAGYGGKRNFEQEKMLSSLTGYGVEVAQNSVGGLKDWFISSGYGYGYTIEVGKDEYAHPLDISVYPEIYEQNKYICNLLESKKWISTKNL